jgi:hypothetical protein
LLDLSIGLAFNDLRSNIVYEEIWEAFENRFDNIRKNSRRVKNDKQNITRYEKWYSNVITKKIINNGWNYSVSFGNSISLVNEKMLDNFGKLGENWFTMHEVS